MTILGAFSEERPAMRLEEISRRTGLAASTTHRLVTELAEWGALTRVDSCAYRIGPLIRRLAAANAANERREKVPTVRQSDTASGGAGKTSSLNTCDVIDHDQPC